MAQNESQRSRGWWWALALVVVLLIIFLYVHFSHQAVAIRTARVARQDIISTVSTNGKVEPIDDFQAHASAPGVVDELYVHLGQQVQKGQPLVRMDDTNPLRDIAAAQANIDSATTTLHAMQQGGTADELITEKTNLAQAQLQLQQNQASLGALQKLQAQGAASANEVAAAQQRLEDTQVHLEQLQSRRSGRYSSGEIDSQRAQVAQSQAALGAARRGFANADIRAPFAGTVYTIPVAQYDFVQAGETLLGIANLNKLQVRAYFDEPEIGSLKAGQAVNIVWDARPNQVWHGHIVEAPTTVISYGATRNVGECVITVDDATGDLLPNTNVTVRVTTLFLPSVLSLPREALHTEGARDFVYKVVDGRLVQKPVQVGVVNLTRFEITGGLKEGDTVALGATTDVDLTNGLQVKVQP
jgi:HlyD family secretion protein